MDFDPGNGEWYISGPAFLVCIDLICLLCILFWADEWEDTEAILC